MTWRNREDLFIAYTWPEVGVDGWGHIPGAAPGAGGTVDPEEALALPQAWVELARSILAAINEQDRPGKTAQTFS